MRTLTANAPAKKRRARAQVAPPVDGEVESVGVRPTAPAMTFRYSGHGTFPCRYTWLPKVVRHLLERPNLFVDEDDAMTRLGVGKNMVRAIKFWAESADVIAQVSSRGGAYAVTDFGRSVFGPDGHDEYLENILTLWLIHWNLSTRQREAPFAWYYLLNHWHRPDFTKPEVLAAFEQETRREDRPLSAVTLEQHCSIFIRSYAAPHGGKQLEDALDCPLNELGLLEEVGERPDPDTGRRDPIYAFRVEDKSDVSPALFNYCLHDFWSRRHPNERTLAVRQVAGGIGSPGQVFKLSESAVRERFETIDRDSLGVFHYQESASIQQIIRRSTPSHSSLIRRIYGGR